jgi:Tfp pilus assembly protein PilO
VSARRPVWQRRLPLLAAAAVFAAANVAVFFSYRASSHTRRDALEARRVELQSSVGVREAEAARLSAQAERLSGVSEAIELFYGQRIGTQRALLASVVAELHAILNSVGVSAAQISYGTSPDKILPLTQMQISFAVKSDYARFKRLLKAFETSRRWLAVRTISIQRDPDQPGSVQVQLDLVTYFDERDGAPGRPNAAPASALPVRKAGP